MSLIPNEDRTYFCEDGGNCFICIGKENCTNYRNGHESLKDILNKINNLESEE